MTGTIKKRLLSLLLALAVLVSTAMVFESASLKAQAADCIKLLNRRITKAEIEAAIEWASGWAKNNAESWWSNEIQGGTYVESKWNCVAFVADAFNDRDGAGISPRLNMNGGPHYLNSDKLGYGHRIYQGEPPRGAIALYRGGSTGDGHVAISLGGGKVIEAGGKYIREADLNANAPTYTYGGYMWYGDMLPPVYEPLTTPTPHGNSIY